MSSKRKKAEEVNSPHATRVKTKCRIKGCTNQAKKGGVCIRHGARPKRKKYTCSNEGCTNGAVKGGVCKRHGAKVKVKTCSREGCTNKSQRKGGVCRRHGAKKTCSHEGCTNHVKKGGVCCRHGAKVKVKTCSQEGCTNRSRGKEGVRRRHGANEDDEYSPSSDECDVEAGGEEIGQEENDVGAEYENGSSDSEEGQLGDTNNLTLIRSGRDTVVDCVEYRGTVAVTTVQVRENREDDDEDEGSTSSIASNAKRVAELEKKVAELEKSHAQLVSEKRRARENMECLFEERKNMDHTLEEQRRMIEEYKDARKAYKIAAVTHAAEERKAKQRLEHQLKLSEANVRTLQEELEATRNALAAASSPRKSAPKRRKMESCLASLEHLL